MIIDGIKIAGEIKERLKKEVHKLPSKPGLAVINIGQNPASQIYVKLKQEACEQIGISSFRYDMPETVSQIEVLDFIAKLNNDGKVNGILIQFPLPKHLKKEEIIEAINPQKDVDGIHPLNIGKMVLGNPIFLPCTASGIMKMLEYHDISLEGKETVVVGNSIIVGDPVAELLSQNNATVTVCLEKTKHLKSYTQNAEILIVAAGCKHLITEDMVRDGAVVIDVGITREKGKVFGDVDFEGVKNKCSFITPVPGGVGPMTVAVLLENTLLAYKLQNKR